MLYTSHQFCLSFSILFGIVCCSKLEIAPWGLNVQRYYFCAVWVWLYRGDYLQLMELMHISNYITTRSARLWRKIASVIIQLCMCLVIYTQSIVGWRVETVFQSLFPRSGSSARVGRWGAVGGGPGTGWTTPTGGSSSAATPASSSGAGPWTGRLICWDGTGAQIMSVVRFSLLFYLIHTFPQHTTVTCVSSIEGILTHWQLRVRCVILWTRLTADGV